MMTPVEKALAAEANVMMLVVNAAVKEWEAKKNIATEKKAAADKADMAAKATATQEAASMRTTGSSGQKTTWRRVGDPPSDGAPAAPAHTAPAGGHSCALGACMASSLGPCSPPRERRLRIALCVKCTRCP